MADTKIGMKIEEEIKPLKELCEKLVKMATAELEQNPQNVDTHEMYEVVDMIKDLADAKKNTVEACFKMTTAEAMEKHEDEYGETWDEDGVIDDGRRGYRGQPRSKTSGRYMSRGDGRRSYTRMMPMDDMDYRMDMDMYNQDPKKLRDMDRRMGRMYYTEQMKGENTLTQEGYTGMGNDYVRTYDEGYADGSTRGYSEGYADGQRQGQNRNGKEGRSGMARRTYMEKKEMNKSNTPMENKQNMESLEEYMKSLSEDITDMLKDMTPTEKSVVKQRITNLANKIQ